MSSKIWDSDDNSLSTTQSILAVGCGVILGIVLLAIASFYSVFAGGFVGMKLWAWFIVPVFGVKALTLTQAWGISAIIAFWTHQMHLTTNKDERTNVEKYTAATVAVLSPWLTLLLAWFIKTVVFGVLS